MRRLAILKMSKDAIPNGGGFGDGLRFLTTGGVFAEGVKKAFEWTRQAIQAVRLAAEPNPWKTATDEEIAAELLRRVDKK